MKKVILVLIVSLAVQSPTSVIGNSPPSFESLDLLVAPTPAREASVLTITPMGWQDPDGDTEQYLYTWYNQDGPLQGTVDFSDNREIQSQEMVPLELPSPLPLPAGLQLTVPMAGSQKGAVKFISPSGNEMEYVLPETLGSSMNGSLIVNLEEAGEYQIRETLKTIIRSASSLTPFETEGEQVFKWTYVNPAPDERLYRYMTRVRNIKLSTSGQLVANVEVADPGANLDVTFIIQEDIAAGSNIAADIDYQADFSKTSSLTLTDTSITTRSISGANFNAGDEVYAVVTAIDGEERGNSLESEHIQILNTPPTLSGVNIGTDVDPPAIPTVLTAEAQGWADDDGDVEQILYQWYNENGLIPDATEATLTQDFSEGERFFVEATAFDGLDSGETLRSSSIVIGRASQPWDVNEDSIVVIFDLVIIANHFGEEIVGAIAPNPDVNGDGIVNIFDVVLVAAHFGETIVD